MAGTFQLTRLPKRVLEVTDGHIRFHTEIKARLDERRQIVIEKRGRESGPDKASLSEIPHFEYANHQSIELMKMVTISQLETPESFGLLEVEEKRTH